MELCTGTHHLNVMYGGKDVSGSPFAIKAYDPTKITVGPIPNAVLRQPVTFNGMLMHKI